MSSERFDRERTAYTLFARDTFDRETPPSADRTGTGLIAGLVELWRSTLSEGIDDEGNATFTRFSLEVRCGAEVDGTDLGVQPFENDALAKIRVWIFGGPEPGEAIPSEEWETEVVEEEEPAFRFFVHRTVATLKDWLFGEPISEREERRPRLLERLPDPRQAELLDELARTHEALLPARGSFVAGWEKSSEASRIGREARRSKSIEELVEGLRRLRS